MIKYTLLGVGIVFALAIAIFLSFDIHFGKNYYTTNSKEADIVLATAKYIHDNFTPDRLDITNKDWLGPAEELNPKMILPTAEGFQIKGSKWLFIKIKHMYIGVHDQGGKNFVAIAKLENKNGKWAVFDYFLINRYDSGWIPPHLKKKEVQTKSSTVTGDKP